jgi:hypothetical protein
MVIRLEIAVQTSIGQQFRTQPRLWALALAALGVLAAAGCSGDRSHPGDPSGSAGTEEKGGPADSGERSEIGSGVPTPDRPAETESSRMTPEEQARAGQLARAGELIDANQFDDAFVLLEQILAAAPDGSQRREARQLQTKLQDRRRALAEVQQAVKQLGSEDRQAVLDAENRLFERADLAMPLLKEAARDPNPAVVKAALETFARLHRPRESLPILVEVLRRSDQQAQWPEAVRQIEAAAGPGAGEPLLALALEAKTPQQQIAALGGLARVADPPRRTAAALLPWIYRDGPELAAALAALAHAMEIHHLHDVGTRRGWDAGLSAEQSRQLDQLPDRLQKLLRSAPADAAGELDAAVRRLAIVTRQVPAEPLSGVRLLAYSVQQDDGPAGALLDGVWNTADPRQMWRYAAGRPGSVVLDLGGTRTVTGVRIWNLNEPGAVQRGWKEAAVCVGDSPALLETPVATGQIPQAPGAADAPDYGVTIPVDFHRGRYVRLREASLWTQSGSTGLTEVQVLGY